MNVIKNVIIFISNDCRPEKKIFFLFYVTRKKDFCWKKVLKTVFTFFLISIYYVTYEMF